jgi:uncharacterized membrane protein
MRKIITSLSKALCVATAVLVGTSATASETGKSCPQKLDNLPLATGYVLDGPLQDKAILEADTAGTTADGEFARWQVGYVYAAGRQVTLDCRYGGQAESHAVPIETPVKKCMYRKSKKHGVSLRCQ